MKLQKLKLDDHFTYQKLFRFVIPSIIMMVFTSVYTVVDGLFVLNVAGKTAFTGLNFIYPVIGVLGAIGFMVGSGGSALVGKKLGEKETANRYFSFFIYTCPVIGIIVAVPTYFLMPQIITALGGSGAMAEEALTYGRTLVCFIPFFVMQMAIQPFFIVAEKTRYNTIITITCGLTNIILDAIFVAGCGLGVFGAALATGICQAIGVIIPLIYFFRPNHSLLRLGKTHVMIRPFLKCLGNGSSEFLTQISMSAVSMMYNAQLLKYIGNDGVAAYGTLMYVSLVFLAVFIGYNLGVSPLISYNFGAQNIEELQNLTKKSLVILSITAVAMCGFSYAMSYPLSLAFGGGDSALIQVTLRGFMLFSLTFLFSGFSIFSSAFFTALNNGLMSFIISLFRTLLFPVLFIFTLPLAMQSDGVWCSMVFSEMCSLIVSILLIILNNKKYHYFPVSCRKE